MDFMPALILMGIFLVGFAVCASILSYAILLAMGIAFFVVMPILLGVPASVWVAGITAVAVVFLMKKKKEKEGKTPR